MSSIPTPRNESVRGQIGRYWTVPGFLVLLSLTIVSCTQGDLPSPTFEFEEVNRQTDDTMDSRQAAKTIVADDNCPSNFGEEEPPEVTALPASPLPSSFKGYVIQSRCWNGQWYFTLEVGLNAKQPCAERSFDDADNGLSYTVKGAEALMKVLNEIPVGTHITWCSFEGNPRQSQIHGLKMTTAAATPDGSLWYAFDIFDAIGATPPGSQNHGLYRLNGGLVSHFDISAPIRVLEVAPDGSLYVGAGCGVMRYSNESWETLLEIDCDHETLVTKLRSLAITFAEDGTVWVGGAFSLASYDGHAWTEYDIHASRIAEASDGTIWTRGWDGRANSNCCLTQLTGTQWITYTWTSDVPAEPEVLKSLLDQPE